MTPIDPRQLRAVTGGNSPAFTARVQQWLKLTEGKSALELLKLPGAPMM